VVKRAADEPEDHRQADLLLRLREQKPVTWDGLRRHHRVDHFCGVRADAL
jgi:hypothetical protein